MTITIEATTSFYTVSSSPTVRGEGGNIRELGFTVDERLIAKRGGNGKYAVRRDFADTHVDGPGGNAHPFNYLLFKASDFLNGYKDYTLTEQDALAELAAFETAHADKGGNFTF